MVRSVEEQHFQHRVDAFIVVGAQSRNAQHYFNMRMRPVASACGPVII